MTHYYYVVYFDDETKEWVHDADIEDSRLNSKIIWNENTGEWINPYKNEEYRKSQEKVDEIFADGIVFLNRISAVWHLRDGK